MNVTLEQARAFDALSTHGTLKAAAVALHKGHTAVLYALTQLEAQTELTLVDRSGYRLRLTPAGAAVLEHCRRLLAAERALAHACAELKTGWEASAGVVFDGIHPLAPLLEWVKHLTREGAPTRAQLSAEFLGGVEDAFVARRADYMIAVLPPHTKGLRARPLAPLRAVLVAHRDHPLAAPRGKRSAKELEAHVLLTVRGSDARLSLPTKDLEPRSLIHLNDFEGKKLAILEGIGFGWLPAHLLRSSRERRLLARVRFEGGSEHVFAPRLYMREGFEPGRAGRKLLAVL